MKVFATCDRIALQLRGHEAPCPGCHRARPFKENLANQVIMLFSVLLQRKSTFSRNKANFAMFRKCGLFFPPRMPPLLYLYCLGPRLFVFRLIHLYLDAITGHGLPGLALLIHSPLYWETRPGDCWDVHRMLGAFPSVESFS